MSPHAADPTREIEINIDTEAVIATSRRVITAAAGELGVNAKELQERTSVAIPADSNAPEVTVTSDTPKEAADEANDLHWSISVDLERRVQGILEQPDAVSATTQQATLAAGYAHGLTARSGSNACTTNSTGAHGSCSTRHKGFAATAFRQVLDKLRPGPAPALDQPMHGCDPDGDHVSC